MLDLITRKPNYIPFLGAIVEKEATPPIPEKVDEAEPENPPVFKKPPDVLHGEFRRIK